MIFKAGFPCWGAKLLIGNSLAKTAWPCQIVVAYLLKKGRSCRCISRDRRIPGLPRGPVVLYPNADKEDQRGYNLESLAIDTLKPTELPAPPQAALRVVQACSQPEVDAQALAEGAMTLITAVRNGGHFILHSCGMMGGYIGNSFEKWLVDEELCGMVRRMMTPLEIDPAKLTTSQILRAELLAAEVLLAAKPPAAAASRPASPSPASSAIRTPPSSATPLSSRRCMAGER